jgi:hypothetical protein
MKLYLYRLTFLTLCLFALSDKAYTQNEGRWYNVEMLIFKRTGSDALTQETWRKDVKLAYPDQYQYLLAADSKNFGIQADNKLQLGAYAYTLRKSENYSVLFHRMWKQQMQNEKDSPAIIIDGGNAIGNHKEMEGYIKLHIGRYLHLTTDLWLTNTKTTELNINDTQWPTIPSQPRDTSTNANAYYTYNNGSQFPVATFREHRRMRSNELHYIDHPLMGILLLITPIEN